MRDTQRSKVYKADRALNQFSEHYYTVKDCERLVRKVFSSKRVQVAFPLSCASLPAVKDGRGRSSACGGYWSISLPTWARTTGIVVHELAHTICTRQYRTKVHAAHGWEFCDIYLKLTLYVMGREAHDALKAAFKENRVKFRPPRKRTITPEQRAVLVERMTAARVAKSKPKSRFAVLDLDA